MNIVKMERPQRKSTLWTRDKIASLIKMYRANECLWNPYHEHYKSAKKRNEAIHALCSCLDINKYEFGKKIHNLRNQVSDSGGF